MTLLDEAWAVWLEKVGADGKMSQGERWRTDNGVQWTQLLAYRGQTAPKPALKSNTGRQMVLETEEWLKTRIPPPVQGAHGFTIAPPVPPVTVHPYTSGLGVNVTTRQDLHDEQIKGTGDSAYLFQKNAGGSSLRRAVIDHVADPQSVTYGTHVIYGKAPDLTIEDILATVGADCESGFSLRFDGAVLQRWQVTGPALDHCITYYETSSKRGQVLIKDGYGEFTGDTAVWMDAETDFQNAVYQSFAYDNVHMRGPAGAKFMKVSSGRMQGSVRSTGSTLNGRAVTSADFVGVPDLIIA